jgi:hypothetical protein
MIGMNAHLVSRGGRIIEKVFVHGGREVGNILYPTAFILFALKERAESIPQFPFLSAGFLDKIWSMN